MNNVQYALIITSVFLAACNPLSDTETKTIKAKVGNISDAYEFNNSVPKNSISKDYWVGQWRVINIWAEWCKPCWQEIPELNEFFAMNQDADVKLMGFNFDELEYVELTSLKAKMSIEFPILTRWPDAWTRPEIKGLPATVIVSPDNLIVDILWGPQTVMGLDKSIENAKVVINNRLK